MFFIRYIVSFAKRVLFEGESKLICIIKALCFQQSFCDFFVGKENLCGYVVVNFLSPVIFVFLFFLGMVMYANEVKTKEKQKFPEIKKLTTTYTCTHKEITSKQKYQYVNWTA